MLRPASTDTIERVAAALPPHDQPVPRSAVQEVLDALSADEVTRLLDLVEQCAPRRWRALVNGVGDELAREPLLVGVVTAAIRELLPPPAWLLAMRESTSRTAPGPIDVLASLLAPESVWSRSEADAAHARFRRHPPLEGLAAVRSFARAEITTWRRHRARYVARSVERALPMLEAPCTSTQLHTALQLVEERAGAAELCELLLFGAVARRDGAVPIVPSRN